MTTTFNQLQAPMEMLGVHQGITVIDPATILTRLWYFDGKFLRAEGFRTDQQYVRSLVALSNQAAGHGLVHGFEARLGSGDSIVVDGGLGIAPSGRVIYLPQGTTLSIAELIERTQGGFAPGATGLAGAADFSLCPADQPSGPDQTLDSSTVWVLTVAAAEALCGEEERFGQLCEDACATETDRSVAVEGVCFRVRPVSLTLPLSENVPFTSTHHRGRVATAWFQAERNAIASGISGMGLQQSLWCEGADGVGGEEVALAVFDRSGTITSWLDVWTARREVMETTPQRYWGWRFAMRPLDVFLAHVLQFQCQLLGLGTDSPTPGQDPCADERAALQAANVTLGALLADPSAAPDADALLEAGAVAAGPLAIAQLQDLQVLIGATLAGSTVSASGSLLVDGGHHTLPSGGYMPVDPEHDVVAQVQALMGPGVDLRFCAVRPDFIPEALQEAQHMERISLTQGIDDPSNLEEVDVLVPGGVVETIDATSTAWRGQIGVLPHGLNLDGNGGGERNPVVELPIWARRHAGDQWSWAATSFFQLGFDFLFDNVETVASAAVQPLREEGPSQDEVAAAVKALKSEEAGIKKFETVAATQVVHARRRFSEKRASAKVTGHVPREVIISRSTVGRAAPPPPDVSPTGLAAMYGWLDFEIDKNLAQAAIFERVPFTLRAVGFGDVISREFMGEASVSGNLLVTAQQPLVSPAGASGVLVTTQLEAHLNWFASTPDQEDSGSEPIPVVDLEWTVGTDQTGTRATGVRIRQDFTADTGQPAELIVGLLFGQSGVVNQVIEGELAYDANIGDNETRIELADVVMSEFDGLLDDGTPDRDFTEDLIEVMAVELAERNRDQAFAAYAGQKLFGQNAAVDGHIAATADWVMFHRRRTKDCVTPASATPAGVRRYRWFHSPVTSPEVEVLFRSALAPGATADDRAAAYKRAGFALVGDMEFTEATSTLTTPASELRAAWLNGPGGDQIASALVADAAGGDGLAIGRARALSALGAVGTVVDSAGVGADWVTPIPDEDHSSTLDGVLYTFAAAVDDPGFVLGFHELTVDSLTPIINEADLPRLDWIERTELAGDNRVTVMRAVTRRRAILLRR